MSGYDMHTVICRESMLTLTNITRTVADLQTKKLWTGLYIHLYSTGMEAEINDPINSYLLKQSK